MTVVIREFREVQIGHRHNPRHHNIRKFEHMSSSRSWRVFKLQTELSVKRLVYIQASRMTYMWYAWCALRKDVTRHGTCSGKSHGINFSLSDNVRVHDATYSYKMISKGLGRSVHMIISDALLALLWYWWRWLFLLAIVVIARVREYVHCCDRTSMGSAYGRLCIR